MRILIAAVVVVASTTVPAFAQTQPTRRSAYQTFPTMRSAWPTLALNPCPTYGFNPTSRCYSGTINPSYSAVTPFEFPNEKSPRAALHGADSLDADQAKSRIEAKGYPKVSGLQKDSHGIWRGEATMKDGRRVAVTLDLEGNIYSELSLLYIRIRPHDTRTPLNR